MDKQDVAAELAKQYARIFNYRVVDPMKDAVVDITNGTATDKEQKEIVILALGTYLQNLKDNKPLF